MDKDKVDYGHIKFAQITEEPQLATRQEYFGVYKGVRFEINTFTRSYDTTPKWTYYLIINIDKQVSRQVAEELWLPPKVPKYSFSTNEIYYDYDSCPAINAIGFHGGCTWYEKQGGLDGNDRIVKFGCDYSHYQDENNLYSLEFIHSEVKGAIEDFLKYIKGKIKIRSNGDGKYRLLEEFTKDEVQNDTTR